MFPCLWKQNAFPDCNRPASDFTTGETLNLIHNILNQDYLHHHGTLSDVVQDPGLADF